MKREDCQEIIRKDFGQDGLIPRIMSPQHFLGEAKSSAFGLD
jgi:hypothetical protein